MGYMLVGSDVGNGNTCSSLRMRKSANGKPFLRNDFCPKDFHMLQNTDKESVLITYLIDEFSVSVKSELGREISLSKQRVTE